MNDVIQPGQAKASCNATGLGCFLTFYTLPAGKRLVIEYASMNVCILPGQSARLTISTSVVEAFVDHLVNTTPVAAAPGYDGDRLQLGRVHHDRGR